MKYILDKDKIMKAAEVSPFKLGVERIVFKDDTFITIAAALPPYLEENEPVLEVIYNGNTIHTDDDLTEYAFEKVSTFVQSYIKDAVKKEIIEIIFE